jgi:hypothetical protein
MKGNRLLSFPCEVWPRLQLLWGRRKRKVWHRAFDFLSQYLDVLAFDDQHLLIVFDEVKRHLMINSSTFGDQFMHFWWSGAFGCSNVVGVLWLAIITYPVWVSKRILESVSKWVSKRRPSQEPCMILALRWQMPHCFYFSSRVIF